MIFAQEAFLSNIHEKTIKKIRIDKMYKGCSKDNTMKNKSRAKTIAVKGCIFIAAPHPVSES